MGLDAFLALLSGAFDFWQSGQANQAQTARTEQASGILSNTAQQYTPQNLLDLAGLSHGGFDYSSFFPDNGPAAPLTGHMSGFLPQSGHAGSSIFEDQLTHPDRYHSWVDQPANPNALPSFEEMLARTGADQLPTTYDQSRGLFTSGDVYRKTVGTYNPIAGPNQDFVLSPYAGKDVSYNTPDYSNLDATRQQAYSDIGAGRGQALNSARQSMLSGPMDLESSLSGFNQSQFESGQAAQRTALGVNQAIETQQDTRAATTAAKQLEAATSNQAFAQDQAHTRLGLEQSRINTQGFNETALEQRGNQQANFTGNDEKDAMTALLNSVGAKSGLSTQDTQQLMQILSLIAGQQSTTAGLVQGGANLQGSLAGGQANALLSNQPIFLALTDMLNSFLQQRNASSGGGSSGGFSAGVGIPGVAQVGYSS